ncbi:MAG: hypothetical protein Q7U07_05295 [Gammaproteobacteria bacterium]|nr:hypothetical protein [Gammaproteobacteria bacterium]
MEPASLSSVPAPSALRLTLRASRRLAALLLLVHAGALTLTFTLPLVPAIMVLLAVAISASLVWSLSAALLKRRAIVELIWDAMGEWTLRDASGSEIQARLLPGAYVHPQWVILNFVPAGQRCRWHRRRHTVILLNDMLDADSLRRLRVRLLAAPHTPPEPE